MDLATIFNTIVHYNFVPLIIPILQMIGGLIAVAALIGVFALIIKGTELWFKFSIKTCGWWAALVFPAGLVVFSTILAYVICGLVHLFS